MRRNDIWDESRRLAVSSGKDLVVARGETKFTTSLKAVGYAAIGVWFACVVVIILALLGFTVLVAKLLSGFIGLLEILSTDSSSGR